MSSNGPRGPAAAAFAAIAVLPLLLVSSCREAAPDLDFSGRNLLLITIDTLRADRLGSYGYHGAQTPNLDRLANEGVRFESAFSPVPLTLPTHSALLTGQYPFTTGVRINGVDYLDETAVTLAELFRADGFDTAAFVSAYVLISKFGLAQGFDEYEDSLDIDSNLFRFTSEIRADETYRRFSNWLSDREEKRFFSWVHFYDPHLPYDPPTPYRERFPESLYDGEIAFVDQYIGKILADLEAAELLDSTLIVVTSDHGEAFGEHVEEGHGLLTYNETLRVPLILYARSGLLGGRVIADPVGLIDLAPTVTELFGLEPGDFDGATLVPLLEGGERPEPSLYFESLAGVEEKNWAPRTGIIARGRKYIEVPAPELYDLDADPLEQSNLFGSPTPAAGEIREELRRELQSLLGSRSRQPADAPGAGRNLDEEDRRHLSALGYLSSGAGGSTKVLDPKQGIEIDMQTRNARTLIRAGEVDRAERVIERLRAENPDIEVADFYELDHDIRVARGDIAGATAALEEGAALFPRGALVLKLASYHLENGNLEESERLAGEILERDPKMSQAVNLLGMIAEKRDRPEQALASFQEALKLEPTSIPLRLRIADLQSQLGRIPQALEIYETLLAAGSLDRSADHLYRAAALNTMAGQLPRAEELFRKGLEIEPAGRHYLALAMVQLRAQKPEDAALNIETALSSFRDDLEPNEVLLAEVLLRQTGRPGRSR